MRVAAAHPATYEELRALPDSVLGQLVNGELVVSPRPAYGHTRAASGLGAGIGGPFDFGKGGPGGWWILYEPEVHLGSDVLVPDLAGWRRERMPQQLPPDEPFVRLAPDWVCEVLSPSTVGVDRVRKNRIYAREGVGHLWFVDPLARTLEVFRLQESQWLELGAYEGDVTVRAEPFDAVELDLSTLWVPDEAR